MAYQVDASTSVVYVTTTPATVLLSSINSPGTLITVRDTLGNASIANAITVSTTTGLQFADGASSNLITQPYGFLTLTPKTSSIWTVINTDAFPNGATAATFDTINAQIATLSSLNTNNIIAQTFLASSISTYNATVETTLSVGQSTITNNLAVQQSAVFNSNLTIYDTLAVASSISTYSLTATSSINADAIYANSLFAESTISTGANLLARNIRASHGISTSFLDVRAIAELSTLNVIGDTNFYQAVQFFKPLSFSNAILTTSSISIGQDLLVGGNISTLGSTTIGGLTTLTSLSAGSATFSNLSVMTNLTVLDSLSTYSNLAVGTSLTVSAAALFLSNVSVAGDLAVAGNLLLQGSITLSNLSTQGDTLIKGFFSTQGAAAFGQDVYIIGSLSTSANVNIGGNLTVANELYVQGPLSTFNTAAFNSTVSIRDNLSVISTLVTGGDLTIGGQLTAGNLIIDDELTVSSLTIPTTTSTGLNVYASTLLQGLVSTTGAVNIGGTLTAQTISTSGPIQAQTLFTTQGISTQSTVIVGDGLQVNGPVTFNSTLTIGGGLTVSQQAVFYSNFIVQSTASFSTAIQVDAGAGMNTFAGDVTYSGGTVLYQGIVTYDGLTIFNSSVGVNTSNPTAWLDVRGTMNVQSNVVAPLSLLRTTMATNYGVGPQFQLYNSATNPVTYAQIVGGITNAQEGLESGFFAVGLTNNGSVISPTLATDGSLILTRSTAIFNTSSVTFNGNLLGPDYSQYITNDFLTQQVNDLGSLGYVSSVNSTITIAQLNASTVNTYYLSTNIFTKLVGTFDIPHPLGSLALPATRLVHSFIEGPRADLIYRGEAKLQAGEATVDLEREATANGSTMTPGTFEALATNPQVFLHNADTFDRVKGTVQKHLLHITSQNPESEARIQWMVLAERHDPSMKAWNRCDSNGFLVLEY